MANTTEGGGGVGGRPPAPRQQPTRDFSSLQQWNATNNAAARTLAQQTETAPGFNQSAVGPGGQWDFTAGYQQPYPGQTLNFSGAAMTPRDWTMAQAVSQGTTPADLRRQQTQNDRDTFAGALSATNAGEVGGVENMTDAEYNALTPAQRAAVDFNTMLVAAVNKDKRNADIYKPTAGQQEQYDQTLKKLFGSAEDRGSDRYAPETVALLNQLGFKSKTADLDDFLHLRASISDQDLLLIPKDAVGPTAKMGPVGDVLDMQRSLAAHTGTLEQQLAKGNDLLNSVTQSAAVARGPVAAGLGGTATAMNALGYGTPRFDQNGQPADLSTAFMVTFDALANAKNRDDKDKILSTAADVFKPNEMTEFMNYVNARSNNAARWNMPLGESKGVSYLSPDEFRKLLGLDEATPGWEAPTTYASGMPRGLSAQVASEVRSNEPRYMGPDLGGWQATTLPGSQLPAGQPSQTPANAGYPLVGAAAGAAG